MQRNRRPFEQVSMCVICMLTLITVVPTFGVPCVDSVIHTSLLVMVMPQLHPGEVQVQSPLAQGS